MISLKDDEFRLVVAAGILAREMLLRTFVAQGVTPDRAENLLENLGTDFVRAGQEVGALSEANQASFISELSEAMLRLRQSPLIAEEVERATRAAGTRPLGWGKQTMQAALGIGLAMTLFSKVVGTGFEYTPERGIVISSPAGLPAGVEVTLARIADAVRDIVTGSRRIGEEGGRTGTVSPKKLSDQGGSSAGVLSSRSSDSQVTLPSGDRALVDRQDAEKAAFLLRVGLGQSYDLPFRLKKYAGEIYWKADENVEKWKRDFNYSLDTGILPVRLEDGNFVYRISVQIQAPTNVKARAIRAIKRELQALTGGLVSIRAVTREVRLLNGDLPVSWRRMAPGLGAPLALSNSPVGTSGLYVRAGEEGPVYLLTAGHVLTNYGQSDPIGQEVFSPPSEFDDPAAFRIGQVFSSSQFTQACNDKRISGDIDIGAVRLDVAQVPAAERRLGVDGFPLRLHVTDIDPGLFKSTIYKGPSLTRRAKATIRALGVSVEMTNPRTMGCFRGDGLVLATLDRERPALPGESGCIVYDADHRPIGLVVAGSNAMAIPTAKGSTNRPVIYIQPLGPFLRANGWSPF